MVTGTGRGMTTCPYELHSVYLHIYYYVTITIIGFYSNVSDVGLANQIYLSFSFHSACCAYT